MSKIKPQEYKGLKIITAFDGELMTEFIYSGGEAVHKIETDVKPGRWPRPQAKDWIDDQEFTTILSDRFRLMADVVKAAKEVNTGLDRDWET